ncbi:hypothetical protein Bca4012_039173 [Brassica carinata]
MWSSIENLKENLNKIALDVYDEDEEDEEVLHIYSSVNVGGGRNSSGHSRYQISSGIESPAHHEIERYKAEIKKLQESESDIKALSVNYAALLRDKEDLADMLEDRTKSLAAVQAKELAKERERLRDMQLSLQEERKRSESFMEELESLRLDKNKTSLEISKVHSELDSKLLEIKHLQDKLNDQESHAVGTAMEHLQEVNKALEKENNELKKETETFPGKEKMEQSCREWKADLKETQRKRDKARQELKRLKQHLLEKEMEESEKMDEDSQLIEELRQANEYQRSQISQLEIKLKQAMASQEDNRKWRITVDDLNQKLTNCLRTIESKNVELLNLQTALGQYYAEIEAKEHFERELAVAKDESMKLNARLKDADERLESSNKEKEDITSKLLQAEKVAAEWKNRVSKVEEDNAKVRRVLEQSMTRLNRMSMESDNLVDRRIVIKLLVTYFQKNHSKEVLDLMVKMLGFSEEDKERIGWHNKEAVESFADLWVDFLLKDAEERERREAEESAAATKATQDSQKTRQDGALSDSEYYTVPLRSSESNQRLSRIQQ